MDTSDRPTAAPWRLVAIAPAALAVLLVAAAELGERRPGNFVVLGQLDRPYMFHTLALLLVALAAGIAVRDPLAKALTAGMLAFCALACAAVGQVGVALRDDPSELSRHRSPNGDRELVTYLDFGKDYVDPAVVLRLRSGRGLLTREWELGCVHSDADHPTGVEWIGPDEVRVNLAYRGPVDIDLDPLTGRPGTTLSIGYC